MSEYQVLLLEDDRMTVERVLQALTGEYRFLHATNAEEARTLVESHAIDLAVLDIHLPGDCDGIEFLRWLKERDPSIVCLMTTAEESLRSVRDCVRLGAAGYLRKPYRIDEVRLQLTLASELRAKTTEREVQEEILRHVSSRPGRIIGSSLAMTKILDQVAELASFPDTSVLITGPTGSGKEVIARAIHREIARNGRRPFIAVNCAAIPATLIESELFGYERGAFTGANQRKIGCLEMAHGGDLFLDEIGELSLEVQVKLLRVLQEREFCRLGGTKLVHSRFRLISATNQNLEQLIAKGTFRRDLFWRLHVYPIVLPALRDRREDIPLLVKEFLGELVVRHGKQVRSAAPELLERFKNMPWEGNVRELRSVIEFLFIKARGSTLCPEDLPVADQVGSHPRSLGEEGPAMIEHLWEEARQRGLSTVLQDLERDIVAQELSRTSLRNEAASNLKIKPNTFCDKLRKLGLR